MFNGQQTIPEDPREYDSVLYPWGTPPGRSLPKRLQLDQHGLGPVLLALWAGPFFII